MTTSKAHERSRRDAGGGETVAGVLGEQLLERARELGAGVAPDWPAVEYQKQPGRFAREILGVQLMPEQLEICEAIRDNRRAAVSGGRKVGKDFGLACAAWWFYCCFPGARVQFTAVTERQVQRIFWRELGLVLAQSGRCLACKRDDPAGPRPCAHSRIPHEGTLPLLARTGLKPSDGRELVGYTAQEAAGIRGISGGYQFDIVDEASDVDDSLIEALDGNKVGCVVGRTALISNPTRSSGQFYRAFHEEQHLWKGFYRDAAEIAKKYGGKIPGIARKADIAELVEKYGPDSDFVQIHVHGKFVENEQGRVFTVAAILASQQRLEATAAEGPLCIGVDVAGESGSGDESAFALRRGRRCLGIETFRGLKPEAHLGHVLRLIKAYPSEDPNHRPTVVIDRGGEPGSKVWGVFIAYRQSLWQDPPFKLVGVDSSRKAQRDPKGFDRVRDELVANLADWMRDGGAIPADPMLAAELNEFRWDEQARDTRSRLIDKKRMRERLNRSPDRADGLALCCWVEKYWKPPTATSPATATPAQPPGDLQDANAIWQEGAGAAAGDDGDPWWPKDGG